MSAASTTVRNKIITKLRDDNPGLYMQWVSYCRATEGASSLIRHSGRYPLTGRSKFNTAGLFVEHFLSILSPNGRAGILAPTGVATDESAKDLFNLLTRKSFLTHIYDFENRLGLSSSAVDSRYRFWCSCLHASEIFISRIIYMCLFWPTSIEDLHEPDEPFRCPPVISA